MRQLPLDAKADPVVVIGLVPRFYLGAIFAIAVYQKIAAPHGYVDAIRTYLTSPAVAGAPGWYASFLSSAVIPHIATWATVVVAGEAFVAFSLLLGFFTRLGAVAAIYMLVNYIFATGITIWNPASYEAADIMLAFVVLMTGPGRIFGIDQALAG